MGAAPKPANSGIDAVQSTSDRDTAAPARSGHRLPSIRAQIALLVLACALPSILGVGVLLQQFYQREQIDVVNDTRQVARALGAAVERDLRSAENTAWALATSPSLQHDDYEAFRLQAASVLRPEFPGVQFVLSDAAGRQFVNTEYPPGAPLPQPANASRLKPVFESGKPVLSNLFIGKLSNAPVLAIDVPVRKRGEIVAALTVVIRPERLGAILVEQRLPPDMIVALLDTNGVIVARTREAARFIGKPAVPAVLERLRTEDDGVVKTGSLEGIPMVASFSRSSATGWTVVVGVPQDRQLDRMLPSVPRVLLGVIVLVLVGLALAWLLGGHIGRSIRALTQPARALASGVPMTLAPMSFREADDVASALKQVEIDVLRHRHELETLVAERTAQLAESKALLENIYASAPVGLSFVDPELRIVMINEYLAAINVRPVSEHIGRPFGDVISDPDVRLHVEQSYRQVLATGQPVTSVELVGTSRAHPGEVLHWFTGYFPVFNADGAIVGITGLLLDMTAQKRSEAQLRQSKQLFMSAFEHMPVMLFVKRAGDLHYEMMNRQGELTLGYARDDVLGKSDYQLFPPDQAFSFTETDRAALESDGVVEVAEEEVRADGTGELRIMHTRKVALRDERGAATHVLGLSIDITARKHADAALRAASQRLERNNAFIRTVTDNLPCMVAYWDAGLRCQFANLRFAEWAGRPAQELIGMSAQLVLGKTLLAENRAPIDAVLAGEAQHFAQDLRLAADDVRHVWSDYIPDLDEHGKARGFFVLLSDVTDLKRNALRLHDLNEELMRARDKAEAASRAKSEFLANMSHEIRTPMNAIIGLARLLEEAPLERRERSYVGKIQLATQSLLGVVNDILDFSKIEAGHLQLEQARFNLDHVLSSIAVLIGSAVWDKGVEPVFDVGPDVPLDLLGDAMRLQQVLMNLMSNAVKFTESGEVVLAVRNLAQTSSSVTLEFCVRDTGIGITDEQQRRIFDAFSQGDTSTSRQYGGTGLGLAICRRLVGLMGGAIELASEPGEGATFRFRCTYERAVANGGVVQAASLPAVLHGLTVAIVDDNATVRAALSSACTALGWRVFSADGGETGLTLLRELASGRHADVGGQPVPLDLLLLDAAMPGLDGISMLTQAHAERGLLPPPTIMMMPDHASEALSHIADSLGIAAVLPKPATPARLLAAVTAVRTGAAQASALPAPTPLSGRLAGMRVLLVEDNEINQEMAQYILLHAGARVDVAANGRIAVDLLAQQSQRYDAVLMDLQMPVMNGFQATAAIRRMGLTKLPIIAMTANALAEDRALAEAAGVDAHAAKPIDVDDLIATMLRLAPPSARTAAGDGDGAQAAWPDRPDSLPGIDLDAALKRLAGNYPAFVGLLKRFENSQGGAVTEVRALLGRDKRHAAAQVLHRLRGVAANLGAADIAAYARQAETALTEARESELAALLAALEQAIAVVTDAARVLPLPLPWPVPPAAGAPHAAGDGAAGSGPAIDLAQALAELVSLLQNSNMKALTHFQALRPALVRDGSADVPALANAIETLDFAAAEKVVQAMLKRKDNG